ncbi:MULTISPECIES: c-type cytochrome biogenesis protein CcsB [Brevibacterium]|jgi:cytochrome c-type biogenesis protein CcsB|uniref:Cytochrome c assembly protein domain-containing protein n=1 Tax=Brevibacterium salitolerans TaxID=1403566 RepID=A0ABP5IGC1_9MICO|nr:c-type cytochrome biogenesis protein CcsB [Brevibacterium sp.]
MNVNTLLAEWSDLLIYSAIAVYAVAFIMYAFDLFGPGFVRGIGAQTGAEAGTRGARSGRASGAEAGREDARSSAAGASGDSARSAGAAAAADAGAGRSGASATAVLETAAAEGTGDGAEDAQASGGDGSAPVSERRLRRWARVGTALTVLAALLQLGAIVTRTAAVMRVPWSNLMEYALIASAFVAVGYIVLLFFKDVRYLGTMVTGAVLLTLGLCITVFYTPAAGIIPALDNYWIWIHVPIAILSTVLLSLSACMAAVQILKAWSEGRETVPGVLRFVRALPSSEDLERTSYRLAAVGFVTWTFTLLAGAFWAEIAWGRYWGWDAKEIWTFVVWVVYAAYLHARATRGWTATRVAVLNLIGVATILFNATIVNTYFDGLHSYAGV